MLFAGCTLLNTSCKEEEDSRLGTEPGHDDAFVLMDNRLVSAHKYVLDFPAAGGTVDLKIVSSGIQGDGPTASSECFGVGLLDQLGEEAIYDYTEWKLKDGPSNSFRDISKGCVSPPGRTGRLRPEVRSWSYGRRSKTASAAVPKPISYSVRRVPNSPQGL